LSRRKGEKIGLTFPERTMMSFMGGKKVKGLRKKRGRGEGHSRIEEGKKEKKNILSMKKKKETPPARIEEEGGIVNLR